MLKKISWIVALFVALTMALVGCTNLGIDPDAPEEDVDRLDLGAPGFNTVAGSPDQQKGWATDGYTDIDNPPAEEGFKLEDFKKAKYLVIETAQNAKGGMTIVWQSKNYPDKGWASQSFAALADNSNANKGVTKESNKLGGQTIKIDIKTVFGTTYSSFIESEGNVRFVIAYYSSNLADLDVQEAYLLLSKEAVSGGTELTGLSDSVELGQLGQTTVRKSATEYGWQFAVKDSKNQTPKGFADIKKLRDADYLLLVSRGGGVGINGGLGGFNEISVTIEATGKYVSGASDTTSLFGKTIDYLHTAGEEIFFLIKLDSLKGSGNIPEYLFDQDDEDKNKNHKVGTIKYYTVNLILETNFAEFGLTKAYLIADPNDDLNKSNIPSGNDTVDMESTFLGQTVTTADSYITKYDLLLPLYYTAPQPLSAVAQLAGSDPAAPGTDPYPGTGNGFIVDPDFSLVKDAPAGSFVRVHVKNVSSGGRSGWGIGRFGGDENNLYGPSGFDPGVTGYVDFLISEIKGSGAWGTDIYMNIWNACEFVSWTLYEAK